MAEKICPICHFKNNSNSKSNICVCCGMPLEDDGSELWQQLKNRADNYIENDISKKLEQNETIAENKSKGIPCCPKCGSTAIHPVQRGFSLITGFVGSGKTLNYCANCGYKWKP